jgi:hypothetical protein
MVPLSRAIFLVHAEYSSKLSIQINFEGRYAESIRKPFSLSLDSAELLR